MYKHFLNGRSPYVWILTTQLREATQITSNHSSVKTKSISMVKVM